MPPASAAAYFPRLSQQGSWEDAAKAYAEVAFILAQRLEGLETAIQEAKGMSLGANGIAAKTRDDVKRVLSIVEHMAVSMGVKVGAPGSDAIALVDATGVPIREKAISYHDLQEMGEDIVEKLRDRPTPAVAFVVPGSPASRKEMTSERVRGAVQETLDKIEHDAEKKKREIAAKRREEITTDVAKKAIWLILAAAAAFIFSHLVWH